MSGSCFKSKCVSYPSSEEFQDWLVNRPLAGSRREDITGWRCLGKEHTIVELVLWLDGKGTEEYRVLKWKLINLKAPKDPAGEEEKWNQELGGTAFSIYPGKAG